MQKALFIIEGVDRVGKTTVIENLAQQLKRETTNKILIIHSKGPKSKENAYAEQQTKFKALIDKIITLFTTSTYDYIILDRSHLGELVYGKWRDNTKDYSYVYTLHNYLLNALKNINVVPVTTLIISPIYKDTSVPYGNGPELERQFIEVFKQLRGVRLVFNNKNFTSLEEKVESILSTFNNILKNELLYYNTIYNYNNYYVYTMFSKDELTEHTCDNPCFETLYNFHVSTAPYGINYGRTVPMGLNSKYIFVGEAPGIKGCGLTGIPFYGDRSGMLFRTALLKLGINVELDAVITNAYWCNPPNNKIKPFLSKPCNKFIEYINKHKDSTIIAVGRTARTALESLNITPAAFIFHPAYYLYKGQVHVIVNSYKQALKDIFNNKLYLRS